MAWRASNWFSSDWWGSDWFGQTDDTPATTYPTNINVIYCVGRNKTSEDYTMPLTIIKQPAEDMLVNFDCSNILVTDQTITSVTTIVEATSVLTFPGSSAVSGQTIQNRVAGGVDGGTYKVTITFATSASPIREADFYIDVKEL